MMASGEQFQKPEEREPESEKAELASLEADLIQRELDHATQGQGAAFNSDPFRKFTKIVQDVLAKASQPQ